MYTLIFLTTAASDVRYFPIWDSSAHSHEMQIITVNGNLSALSLTQFY